MKSLSKRCLFGGTPWTVDQSIAVGASATAALSGWTKLNVGGGADAGSLINASGDEVMMGSLLVLEMAAVLILLNMSAGTTV